MASQTTPLAPPTAGKASAEDGRNGLRFDMGKLLTYAVLLTGAVVAIVPFFYTVSVSLMNLTEATGGAWLPRAPQWGNYEQAWRDASFSLYFMNSVKITLITVIGELVFCTWPPTPSPAWNFPARRFFALLLSTLMLPEAVTWVPNFITVSWLGRIGPIPWINNWPALTIPFMAGALGIFLLRQFFQQDPNELWDSAQIDGPDICATWCASCCRSPKRRS